MKLRLDALVLPTGIYAVLLILLPAVSYAATQGFDPNVAGNVQLDSGTYTLELDPFSLFTQQLLSSNIDARVIIEFPLDTLPASAVLTAATLELDVNLRTTSGGVFPRVPVFGYQGDGVGELDDAGHVGFQLGLSEPLVNLGMTSVDLDVEFIAGLLGNTTHLGLVLMGDENGFQAGFDNFIDTPVLNLTFSSDPGDFDFDGDVDGIDFLKWQRGESPTPNSAQDLMDWEQNYGAPSMLAAITAVPEPAAMGLALFGAVGLLIRRRPAIC